jgi:hypothetical protein
MCDFGATPPRHQAGGFRRFKTGFELLETHLAVALKQQFRSSYFLCYGGYDLGVYGKSLFEFSDNVQTLF